MRTSILVVDDDPMMRSILRLMLETAGFSVYEAVDGVDALCQLKTILPKAIILDLMMPNLDGISVCKALRTNRDTADVPVIVLSAKTRLTAIQEAFDAGATLYVQKPVERNDMLQKLCHLVRHPESRPAMVYSL